MIEIRCFDCNRLLATRLAQLGDKVRKHLEAKHGRDVHHEEVLAHPAVQNAQRRFAQRSRRVYHCECGTAIRHVPDPDHPHKVRPVRHKPA